MKTTRTRSVDGLHVHLRKLIHNGTYPPGAVLSQVRLAEQLGVSRTPLREAIRRLEAEGLVESEQNHRARVATADAEAIDVMFTDLMLLQATGVKVTIPLLTEIDLNGLLASLAALRVAFQKGNRAACERARRTLQAQLVAHTGKRLRARIADRFTRCEAQRRHVLPLSPAIVETYEAIAGACIARNADEVVRRLARLEATIAQGVLEIVDSSYRPTAIGVALAMLERQ